MLTDPATLAVAVLAVLVAGVSKGGFGAGIGFLATPLLALTLPPATAAAIMLPILILMDQLGMVSYWRKWRWATVWPAVAAATVGIGLGALMFGRVDAAALRLGLGLIALAFTAFLIARAAGWAPPRAGGRRASAAIWGATSGFTSTISHAGGPPITIYLLGERLDKTAYQASTVLIFWAINLIKLIPYGALGVLDLSTLETSAKLFPAAVIGVGLGIWLHKRVPERLYFRVMVGLLTVTALKLVWDGAQGLGG